MVGTLNLVYYTEQKGKSEGMVLYTEHLRVDVKTDEETKPHLGPDLVAVSGEDQCQLPPPPTGTGLSQCQLSPPLPGQGPDLLRLRQVDRQIDRQIQGQTVENDY